MIKRIAEVELYHGQASFNKIYPKDISRTFKNGRSNIIIYRKPSFLVYQSHNSKY